MGISAEIVADSIAANGKRLTTFVLTYPRFIHSEVMTHRMFSRNAASSRAIPVKKIIDQVLSDPALPIHWGKNQPGMQADSELSPEDIEKAKALITSGAGMMVALAETLMELGLHKQVTNRYLEPWFWMRTILTGTEFGNFYHLRDHNDAQPEFRELAKQMRKAHRESEPRLITRGKWHLPFVKHSERGFIEDKLIASVARCARVSYLNHDGTNPQRHKDEELYRKLIEQPHASPFEHQATPAFFSWWASGNFRGWKQYRKTLKTENHAEVEI